MGERYFGMLAGYGWSGMSDPTRIWVRKDWKEEKDERILLVEAALEPEVASENGDVKHKTV